MSSQVFVCKGLYSVIVTFCLFQLYDIRAMKELESFRGHQKDVTCKNYLFVCVYILCNAYSTSMSSSDQVMDSDEKFVVSILVLFSKFHQGIIRKRNFRSRRLKANNIIGDSC